jgi:S1-C subfamily serine protease
MRKSPMNVRTKITAAFCAFLFFAAVPNLGYAQGFFQRQAPETRAQAQLSFAPLVKQAAPAVVNVYGARREQRGALRLQRAQRPPEREGGSRRQAVRAHLGG